MRIRAVLAVVAGLAGLLVPMASPASADPADCVLTGDFQVSPGLIDSDPLRYANFSFSSGGGTVGGAICTNGINHFSGSGQLRGNCEHWTAGVVTPQGIANVAGHVSSFIAENQGGVVHIIGTDPSMPFTAVLQLRPSGADPANGVMPCYTHLAASFAMVGHASVGHL